METAFDLIRQLIKYPENTYVLADRSTLYVWRSNLMGVVYRYQEIQMTRRGWRVVYEITY